MNWKGLAAFCLSLIAILAFFSMASAQAADYPEYIGYVNDYARLLSPEQAIELNQELADFDRRTTIEFAVVTLDSIAGHSPGDYAVDLGNHWEVGKQGEDNGIILLVAMDSHDIWIETGPGLAGQITDRQVQDVVDQIIIPQFRAGRPDQGIVKGAEALIRHFDGSILAPPAGTAVPPGSSAGRDGREGYSFIWIAAAFVLLIAIGWASFGILNPRFKQAKVNKEMLVQIRKGLDGLVEKATLSLGALEELKSYAPSIWGGAEADFNSVDLNNLELKHIEAKKASDKGWIQAYAAKEMIAALENDLEIDLKNVNSPTVKLAQIKKAKSESLSSLERLDAAILRAENEARGKEMSMATTMELEKAKQLLREAKALANQPEETVDWIILIEKIQMAEKAAEQVGLDGIKGRPTAEMDPEMIGRNEIELARLGEAQRSRQESASVHQPGFWSTLSKIFLGWSLGRSSNDDRYAGGWGRDSDRTGKERSSGGHIKGGSSGGSRSSGGGRMGGGSSGGGHSGGGGRTEGGSSGGSRSGGGGRTGGGSRGGGKW